MNGFGLGIEAVIGDEPDPDIEEAQAEADTQNEDQDDDPDTSEGEKSRIWRLLGISPHEESNA